MRENIIIGDTHGCIDEFNALLDKIGYDEKRHRVILVGDLIDRGRDPAGLVAQVRKMGLECVAANHESKCLRWHKHEIIRKTTGIKNPIEVAKERQKEWEALSVDDLAWMASLPPVLNIKENWYVVHAGMEPGVPFEQQDPDTVIRMRYVDKDGRYVKTKKSREQPEGTKYWAKKWNQPYNLVFGHHQHSEPTRYRNENNVCVAIDQSCCFGGSLTAFNVERDEFVQVKAMKKYWER